MEDFLYETLQYVMQVRTLEGELHLSQDRWRAVARVQKRCRREVAVDIVVDKLVWVIQAFLVDTPLVFRATEHVHPENILGEDVRFFDERSMFHALIDVCERLLAPPLSLRFYTPLTPCNTRDNVERLEDVQRIVTWWIERDVGDEHQDWKRSIHISEPPLVLTAMLRPPLEKCCSSCVRTDNAETTRDVPMCCSMGVHVHFSRKGVEPFLCPGYDPEYDFDSSDDSFDDDDDESPRAVVRRPTRPPFETFSYEHATGLWAALHAAGFALYERLPPSWSQ